MAQGSLLRGKGWGFMRRLGYLTLLQAIKGCLAGAEGVGPLVVSPPLGFGGFVHPLPDTLAAPACTLLAEQMHAGRHSEAARIPARSAPSGWA